MKILIPHPLPPKEMLTAKLITQGGQSQQFKLSGGMGEMEPQNIKYPLSARVFCLICFCLFVFLFCFVFST